MRDTGVHMVTTVLVQVLTDSFATTDKDVATARQRAATDAARDGCAPLPALACAIPHAPVAPVLEALKRQVRNEDDEGGSSMGWLR